MRHEEFNYVKEVVEKTKLNVLLEGPAGTSKTTMAMQVAEELNLPFYCSSLTKQTSVNALLGFKAINGAYIASEVRSAYEDGGLLLLDEIDAADPNVLLTLNTIENGFIAFPDKIMYAHKDFKIMATANPQSDHSIYTGRSKLDFSSIDRWYQIVIDPDHKLEEKLTSPETVATMEVVRELIKKNGSSIPATMRDAIRVYELTKLGLDENPIEKVVLSKDATLLKIYREEAAKIRAKLEAARQEAERKAAEDAKTQHDMSDLDTLWNKVEQGK